MKKTYTTPEVEITKFGTEEEILMVSGLGDNEAENPWGDEDLG